MILPPLHNPLPPPGTNNAGRPNASGVLPSGAVGYRPAVELDALVLKLPPPPLRELRVSRPVGSGISSLTEESTNATTTASNNVAARVAVSSSLSRSSADDTTPLSGNKRQANDLGEDEDAPPVYPDYSITKSSGDSVASGDDSIQWEEEAERILAAH